MTDVVEIDDERENLHWHALNYRTAVPQHAELMWQKLVSCVDRKIAAERERCAKIADEHARRNYPWGSENSDIYHAQANLAERIAKVIRHDPA